MGWRQCVMAMRMCSCFACMLSQPGSSNALTWTGCRVDVKHLPPQVCHMIQPLALIMSAACHSVLTRSGHLCE